MSDSDQAANGTAPAPIPGPPGSPGPRPQPPTGGAGMENTHAVPSQPEPVAAAGDSQNPPRFPATGDPQVDQALAALPDPDALPSPAELAQRDGDGGDRSDDSSHEGADSDSPNGTQHPDLAAHLDGQIADVTTVHRRLQQRLSDLSG